MSYRVVCDPCRRTVVDTIASGFLGGSWLFDPDHDDKMEMDGIWIEWWVSSTPTGPLQPRSLVPMVT